MRIERLSRYRASLALCALTGISAQSADCQDVGVTAGQVWRLEERLSVSSRITLGLPSSIDASGKPYDKDERSRFLLFRTVAVVSAPVTVAVPPQATTGATPPVPVVPAPTAPATATAKANALVLRVTYEPAPTTAMVATMDEEVVDGAASFGVSHFTVNCTTKDVTRDNAVAVSADEVANLRSECDTFSSALALRRTLRATSTVRTLVGADLKAVAPPLLECTGIQSLKLIPASSASPGTIEFAVIADAIVAVTDKGSQTVQYRGTLQMTPSGTLSWQLSHDGVLKLQLADRNQFAEGQSKGAVLLTQKLTLAP